MPPRDSRSVPCIYLSLLRNVDAIRNYAWGATLLCHLHHNLREFNTARINVKHQTPMMPRGDESNLEEYFHNPSIGAYSRVANIIDEGPNQTPMMPGPGVESNIGSTDSRVANIFDEEPNQMPMMPGVESDIGAANIIDEGPNPETEAHESPIDQTRTEPFEASPNYAVDVEGKLFQGLASKSAFQRHKQWLQHAKTHSAQHRIMKILHPFHFLREQIALLATEITIDSVKEFVAEFDEDREMEEVVDRSKGAKHTWEKLLKNDMEISSGRMIGEDIFKVHKIPKVSGERNKHMKHII
ncbi:GTP diphosphokinase RSH1, chloroplastic [Olea europaea subsp. europaea]|uniref:GTP diphosphokinase RSH1, chloroplastic n=1 Tax=Olea europaea subsp. europaea TaxID=158383 RepID=A0A8S0SBX6_OLEEU|nr:GTP diphosphokinase RSH1, chloroplastic [Olea europaea subsp. europaea]